VLLCAHGDTGEKRREKKKGFKRSRSGKKTLRKERKGANTVASRQTLNKKKSLGKRKSSTNDPERTTESIYGVNEKTQKGPSSPEVGCKLIPLWRGEGVSTRFFASRGEESKQ